MGPKKKQRKSTGSSDCEIIFKEGDLVGAKIKGHPLWPGRIETIHETANGKGKRKYTVRFFGSDDTSQSSIQIKLFDELTDQEKACTRRGFKEALDLCQQEYNLLAQTSTKSHQEHQTDADSKDEKIFDNQSAFSSPDLQISNEFNEKPSLEKQTPIKSKLEEKPKEKPIDVAIVKDQDGENVQKHSETLRKLTLAKLQEKVKKKIKEKEALKNQLRERKSFIRYSPKLLLINQKLKHISSLADRFSKANKFGKKDLQQWNSAVRMYQTLSAPLTKCVNFFNRNNMKLSPECRECRETLVSIVTNVKRAQNDSGIPSTTKKELKKITRLMKNSELIDFINDDLKNAKENDSD